MSQGFPLENWMEIKQTHSTALICFSIMVNLVYMGGVLRNKIATGKQIRLMIRPNTPTPVDCGLSLLLLQGYLVSSYLTKAHWKYLL